MFQLSSFFSHFLFERKGGRRGGREKTNQKEKKIFKSWRIYKTDNENVVSEYYHRAVGLYLELFKSLHSGEKKKTKFILVDESCFLLSKFRRVKLLAAFFFALLHHFTSPAWAPASKRDHVVKNRTSF